MFQSTPLTGIMYGLMVRNRGALGYSPDEVMNEQVRKELRPVGNHEMALITLFGGLYLQFFPLSLHQFDTKKLYYDVIFMAGKHCSVNNFLLMIMFWCRVL